MREYLIQFVQVHSDFRIPELHALATLFNIEIQYNLHEYSLSNPFFICKFKNDEDVKKVAKRAILIKNIIQLFTKAKSLEETIAFLKATNNEEIQEYKNHTFKISVEPFNFRYTQDEQLEIIERFKFLPLEGKIELKSPEVTFCYFEDFATAKKEENKKNNTCIRSWFGRLVSQGNRSAINKYDLKKREYLGITSMDAELSLIMANQALVKPGSLVLDPYVGTGSFLITCSHFGGYTLGTDIDGRQIRGKSAFFVKEEFKGEGKSEKDILNKKKVYERNFKSIESNVEQYALKGRVLGNIVTDSFHHPWRKVEFFDAIVCDPPYGVRAGAKKIGLSISGVPASTPLKSNGESRYPSTVPYEMDQVLLDLLDFSAVYLQVGGRLVYWFPTVTEKYSDLDIPKHPQLKLISNSEQNFGKWARRLITMEKLPVAEVDSNFSKHSALDLQIEINISCTASENPAHKDFKKVYFQKRDLENLRLKNDLVPPPRSISILHKNNSIQLQSSEIVGKISKRKPSLVINTKNVRKLSKELQQPLSCPLPRQCSSNQEKIPSHSPVSCSSSVVMNPLQRLSNLASLMVYVIWFDIPLNKLLAEWNVPGNRYYKFRMKCEKVLSCTRLSPSVVVVGLKYLQRVKVEKTKFNSKKFVDRKNIQHNNHQNFSVVNNNNENINTNMNEDDSNYFNTAFPNESTIWAACLLLAHKYLDDKHFSNPTFAQVNLITAKELNLSEMECLKLLNFRLCVLEEEYTLWRKNLQEIVTDSIKSINQSKAISLSNLNSNKEPIPQLPIIRGVGLTNKEILFPPNRSRSPYQIPVSPGILNTPSNSLWSPASSLVTGGPLRLGQRHLNRQINKKIFGKHNTMSTSLDGPKSAGLISNDLNVNFSHFLPTSQDDSATFLNSSESTYPISPLDLNATIQTPGILRLSDLQLGEEKTDTMDLS
ncbi:hypothetical protein HDU92_003538 [Lobulomyces angularis]|nr:hypothetical protein HDU92_003538 [Lobulomyces angularis]